MDTISKRSRPVNTISGPRKIISLVLKLITVISAVLGIVMSAAAGRNSFMGGSRVFMYFTIQSNLLIALICLIGGFLLMRNRPAGNSWYTVKLVGTVSITLTGVVFVVLLAPILGSKAWNIQNTLTHAVVPLAAVLDFFVSVSGHKISRKNVFFVIIPPLFYVIYAGIGFVRGWEFARGVNYPYFFLNWGSPAGAFGFTKGLPYMGCVWWILVLFLFLIAVGWGYAALADRLGKRI
ncbi:MAG: Pr6Pr family membrane protein [Lachnospiraceae bacterium]|nr:Pr6Pr family membrane protein [Lachnospiraceae bacterium]